VCDEKRAPRAYQEATKEEGKKRRKKVLQKKRARKRTAARTGTSNFPKQIDEPGEVTGEPDDSLVKRELNMCEQKVEVKGRKIKNSEKGFGIGCRLIEVIKKKLKKRHEKKT